MRKLTDTDRERLCQDLDTIAARHDISGAYCVLEHGQIIYDRVFGWADRELQIPSTPTTRYLFDCEDKFFVSLAMFCLIDEGRLQLGSKFGTFIPEYPQGAGITIRQLMKESSGLPDAFYGKVMLDLDKDDAYKDLDDLSRLRLEERLYHQNRSFTRTLALLDGLAPLYPPGTPDMDGSTSNAIFLAELIRRVSGQSVFEYLQQQVFQRLGMHSVHASDQTDVVSSAVSYEVYRNTQLVRLPLDFSVDSLFSIEFADIKKLLQAFALRHLFSQRLWQTITKLDAYGNGLLFRNVNGYYCAAANFLGSSISFYFNHDNGVAYASLLNESQKLNYRNGRLEAFMPEAREAITAAYCYPHDTKMVRLNKSNFWDALRLEVAEGQEDFVLEAKSSVAMGLMFKTKEVYVQMEGLRAVGLLVLDINKKAGEYLVNIVLVDKRFQGRGYGKLMIKFAVERLKSAGARELTIGVNRYNYAAQKVYTSAGFVPKMISEQGIDMCIQLDKTEGQP